MKVQTILFIFSTYELRLRGTGIRLVSTKDIFLSLKPEFDVRTRKIRVTLGFKSFSSANKTIAGIEAMSMIRKEQVLSEGARTVGTFWAIFR